MSRRFGAGDINGCLALLIDSMSLMAFMAGGLIGLFGFPADVIYYKMFPGTALGVLLGNLGYTLLARQLARREGRSDVTAMPLGLDAPTTIGMALLVLGPAYLGFKQAGMEPSAAALKAWQLGTAAMVVMGLCKWAAAYVSNWLQRHLPRAALLGTIAGAALALMGFLPLLEIMRLPIVGLAGIGLVLYSLLARGRLPFGLPGVLGAVLVALVLYYLFGVLGWLGQGYQPPAAFHVRVALPWPSLAWWHGLAELGPYLSLVIPFALLDVIGAINVTESASAAGDAYSARHIVLVEAFSTLAAGVCGGVAQTTPYIGQPSYKAMGARTGYTLLAGIVIGLGGILGYLSNLVEWLPLAVLAPVLIYVAISITTQAFEMTSPRYAGAMVLGFFPPLARMLTIKLSDPHYVATERFAKLLADHGHGMSELAVIVALGNGFALTSMIWIGFLVAMIDQRLGRAGLLLLIGAALSLFGVIHSVRWSGAMYLPWQLSAAERAMMGQFAGAYLVLALLLLLLSGLRRRPPLAVNVELEERCAGRPD